MLPDTWTRAFRNGYAPVPAEAIIPFGKYRGITVIELVDRDPRYAKWLINHTDLEVTHPDTYFDIDARLLLKKVKRQFGLD